MNKRKQNKGITMTVEWDDRWSTVLMWVMLPVFVPVVLVKKTVKIIIRAFRSLFFWTYHEYPEW